MRYESFYPFNTQSKEPLGQQTMNNSGYFPSPFAMMPGQANQQALPPSSQPSKLENYMQTADRFLSTAQQYAPLIQQFAPMLTNLPSIWRLYKGVQSMPDRSASSERQARSASRAMPDSVPTKPGPSTPMIFQPNNPIL